MLKYGNSLVYLQKITVPVIYKYPGVAAHSLSQKKCKNIRRKMQAEERESRKVSAL